MVMFLSSVLDRRAITSWATLLRLTGARRNLPLRAKPRSCFVSCGRALGGLLDGVGGVVRVGVRASDCELEHVGVPENAGEEVVEIVGDAAGELPDGLHLLRLGELELEVAAVGDVAPRGENGRHVAAGIGFGHEPPVEDKGPAAHFAGVLHREGLPGLEDAAHALVPVGYHLRRHAHLGVSLAEHLLLRQSAEDTGRRIRIEMPPLPVDALDDVGGVLGEGAITLLARPQGLFGLFSGGDVAAYAHDAGNAAVGVAQRDLARKQPPLPAVAADDDFLVVEDRLSGAEDFLVVRPVLPADFAWEEVDVRLAEHFISRGGADEADVGRVAEYFSALSVDGVNAVRQEVYERLEEVALLRELLLRAYRRGNVRDSDGELSFFNAVRQSLQVFPHRLGVLHEVAALAGESDFGIEIYPAHLD